MNAVEGLGGRAGVKSSWRRMRKDGEKVRYVAIYGRLSRDKSLYMRPHRGGPLYETPSGAPHGITLIPLWSTYTVGEKSLRCYAGQCRSRLEIENK